MWYLMIGLKDAEWAVTGKYEYGAILNRILNMVYRGYNHGKKILIPRKNNGGN